MLYLGGKGRAGKPIASAILATTTKRDVYVEPCIGGGNAFKHLAPHFKTVFAGDVHEDLMLMWQAAQAGWNPPSVVSEEEYRIQKRTAPSPMRGFVGFGCSFGGKWWGGYARSKQNGDDYYARHAAASVIEIASIMRERQATLVCASYEAWSITTGSVVYVDPPYRNTTGYKGGFDSDRFWYVMDSWCDTGAMVFVSEYAAPPHWKCLWQKEQRRKVSGGTGDMTCERLFFR